MSARKKRCIVLRRVHAKFGMSDFKNLRVWQEAHQLTLDTVRACEELTGNVGTGAVHDVNFVEHY
jgi:hypothetical protein